MTIQEMMVGLEPGPDEVGVGPAERWTRTHVPFALHTGGSWTVEVAEQAEPILSPAGATLGTCVLATPEMLDIAVLAAGEAAPVLSVESAPTFLYRFAALLETESILLQGIAIFDGALSQTDAEDQVNAAIRVLRAAAPRLPDGRPAGTVVAALGVRWPIFQAALALAAALTAGCPIVFAADKAAPLSAFAFAELAERAGLPAGSVCALVRSRGALEAAASHPGVAVLSQPGELDALDLADLAAIGKPVWSALRGTETAIILASADLPSAAAEVAQAAWGRTGPWREGALRVLVQEGIQARFERLLTDALNRTAVPESRGINSGEFAAAIGRAANFGAKALTPPGAGSASPTLLLGLQPATTHEARLPTGPVALVYSFRTIVEAAALEANDALPAVTSIHGLDLPEALSLAALVRAPIVPLNACDPTQDAGCFLPQPGAADPHIAHGAARSVEAAGDRSETVVQQITRAKLERAVDAAAASRWLTTTQADRERSLSSASPSLVAIVQARRRWRQPNASLERDRFQLHSTRGLGVVAILAPRLTPAAELTVIASLLVGNATILVTEWTAEGEGTLASRLAPAGLPGGSLQELQGELTQALADLIRHPALRRVLVASNALEASPSPLPHNVYVLPAEDGSDLMTALEPLVSEVQSIFGEIGV